MGDELLESRLFGHKAGSFKGATGDRDGIFKLNNRGTVFLDEVGDISPRLQQSLLRLLQEGEIQLKHPEKGRLKPDKHVIQFVKSYPWPGNIRQLEHFVENLYVFCEDQVSMDDIPSRFMDICNFEIRKIII